jgi:hypothetical protein
MYKDYPVIRGSRLPLLLAVRLCRIDFGVDLALGLEPVVDRLAVLSAACIVDFVGALCDPRQPGRLLRLIRIA